MPLWIFFPTLAAALFAVVVLITAMGVDRRNRTHSLPLSERDAWWRLLWPLFAGSLAIAFLFGWALQEPDPADEWIAFEVWAVSGVAVAIVLRAFYRACRSARAASRTNLPIATIGLFRCRTLMSDSFKRAATAEVMVAALAHEAAHARWRDPIRIWIAQFAADLQWPIPGARRRLEGWILALETARDDEAIAAGAQPTALAESILLAASLQSGVNSLPCASITGRGDYLAFRVRRLLSASPVLDAELDEGRRTVVLWCCAALAMAASLGVLYGDAVLMLLPGVER